MDNNGSDEQIPFEVDIQRIIDVLAKQIYQNVYALLRENCQNGYDAILMRAAKEPNFKGTINIEISDSRVIVKDNGIGMSKNQLKNNFWKAGSSSKNSEEARSAGVVGTFGIGAMANFGIANKLEIDTKSADNFESHYSYVSRDKLSVTEKCIQIMPRDRADGIGTTIVAEVDPGKINLADAKKYISDIVKFLDIPVSINGENVSGNKFEDSIEKWPDTACVVNLSSFEITAEVFSDIKIVLSLSGTVWVRCENFIVKNKPVKNAHIVLKSDQHSVLGYRSRFFLSAIPVNSIYKFGGIVNLPFIEPTAGREALLSSSISLVQSIFSKLDDIVSEKISTFESCDSCTHFLTWLVQKRNFNLIGNVKLRTYPSDIREKIADLLQARSGNKINFYEGNTKEIIESFSSEDSKLVILSQTNPRRQLESTYLNGNLNIFTKISDNPTHFNDRDETKYSTEESAVSFRLVSILKEDYFVETKVLYSDLSHGLPILVDGSDKLIRIYLDKSKPSIQMLFQIYQKEFYLISGFVKDFIRTTIFPKIANFVPSHTRQGAEAFLKAISRPKDYFELEYSDRAEFKDIWGEYQLGKLSLNEAIEKSNEALKRTVQIFDVSSKVQAKDVINEVIQSQQRIIQNDQANPLEKSIALPAIVRGDIECASKMLIIDENDPPLNGYRCFIAITDSAKSYRGEFFFQPHRTEIIWAGQKLLFIFFHHSEEFGFYYELISNDLISKESGGDSFLTSTIIIKDQIYIPVPDQIKNSIIPTESQRKRFEVKYEILTPENSSKK